MWRFRNEIQLHMLAGLFSSSSFFVFVLVRFLQNRDTKISTEVLQIHTNF